MIAPPRCVLPLWIFVASLTVAQSVCGEPLDLGNRRELFVDQHLIDNLANARLCLHEPRHEGVALRFDRPWEGAFCGYVTVLHDGERFRMYYRGLPEAGRDGSSAEVTCYAQSQDGIHWEKPNVGVYEIDGSHDNNVVLQDQAPFSHNFSPFLDTRPDVSADQRFKALAGTASTGLMAFVSADGLHWRRLQEEPVFNDSGWVFDSQNVPFWSQSENCYVLYYRKAPEKIRSIARATSTDFVNWSEPAMMTYGDTPAEHLYTNQTHPYYRAPHIYVGIAARFMPGRQVLTADQAASIGVDPRYFGDISDAVLLTTRGGSEYQRTFMEGFIRPGLGWENWVSRTNYPALGIVPTHDTQMSVYVQKNYGQPTARLDRYSLRLDGFASVCAPYSGGEVITKPLTFTAADNVALEVNFSTSAAGELRVEIQDDQGAPITGFAANDSSVLIGDDIGRAVTWKGGQQLRGLAKRPIRLRFIMRDADLFAFQFRPLAGDPPGSGR